MQVLAFSSSMEDFYFERAGVSLLNSWLPRNDTTVRNASKPTLMLDQVSACSQVYALIQFDGGSSANTFIIIYLTTNLTHGV